MYDNNAQAAKFSLSPKNIKSLNREFSFTVLFNQIQMYDNNAQAAKFSLSPNIKSFLSPKNKQGVLIYCSF